MVKYCVLDGDRLCADCGDCLVCDIDSKKRCDNCMQCVKKSGADYLSIEIDEVIAGMSEDDADIFEQKVSPRPTARSGVRGIRPKRTRESASDGLGKPD